MPAAKDLDPEASLWDLFGAHLRFLRKLAGKTQQELGGELHSTGAFVGQIETADRRPSPEFVADLDRALGRTGLLTAIAFHAYRLTEGQPGWFENFAESERQAFRIRTFQPQAIPGLLQCEEYIRALLQKARVPPPIIEAWLTRRLKRKRLLTKKEAPQYWAAIDEAAVLRLKHDPRVAATQLLHLLEVSELPNVVLEVVPMDCGLHACMDGAFVLLSIPGRGECAFADGMVEGKMITEGHMVAEFQRRYDLLRTETLSPARSQQLLRNLLEST
ncbi:helix-turn-helix domain-containing protein [Embleya hyalina]|uniref:Transcriptional regulator n=1 Tax=Embleya hyalina TaxID=516124 RepID=A0A401Z278_9ACTN|nr:helix-turn-helix transcriptional regulator [Embleya hyalina]GCE00979.1 transcriptional regulator [Embleya hyalina]